MTASFNLPSTADLRAAGEPIAQSQDCDLRLEADLDGMPYRKARLWTARGTIADGHPFGTATVYVEVFNPDRGSWVDLGHYDGTNPPMSLPGLTGAELHLEGTTR